MRRFYKYFAGLPNGMTWFSVRIELLIIAFLVAGLVIGCTETTDTTEPELSVEEMLLEEKPDNVYFIPSEEAEEFRRALLEFHSKVYIKDGRLEVDYQIGRDSDIPSKWLPQFFEAMHSVNHMLETGEITVEDLEKKEAISSRDFLYPPDKSGGDRVPGDWSITYDGWGRVKIYMSDVTYGWLLYGGITSAKFLAYIGGVQASFLILFATGYYATHYSILGKGGGIEITTWLGLIHWINYPPPIEMDQEMDQ